MKSVAIFSHALRQVFGNAGAVVRLTLILTLVPLVVILALGVQPYMDGSASEPPELWPWPEILLALGVGLAASLWVAVGWHRYILLDEMGPGITPRWNGSRILAYLWASIITILVILLVGLVVGLAGGLVLGILAATTSGEPSTAQVVLFVALGALLIMAPILAAFFRVAAIMPAAAIGKPLRLSDAWAATTGSTGAFYVLALMLVVVSLVLGQVGTLFPVGSIGASVWFFLVQWVNLILGLSILTTIYGHYIERRELL